MPDTTAKKHILAINNSDDVLDLFEELLEEEGYQVTKQAYVNRDIDEISVLAPDLIILDYMWGSEDDGWSLLQMLKMSPKTTQIPIALCTGAVKRVEEFRGHLTDMGIAVVFKPFDLDELTTTIARELESAAESGR